MPIRPALLTICSGEVACSASLDRHPVAVSPLLYCYSDKLADIPAENFQVFFRLAECGTSSDDLLRDDSKLFISGKDWRKIETKRILDLAGTVLPRVALAIGTVLANDKASVDQKCKMPT